LTGKTLLETGQLLTTPGSLRYASAAGRWHRARRSRKTTWSSP